MKTMKILMMAVMTILSVGVIAQDTTKQKHTKEKTEKVNYSCPMHPEVISDKPGSAVNAEWI